MRVPDFGPRIVGLLVAALLVAFALGWAFRAYLSADAVLGFAGRYFLCN